MRKRFLHFTIALLLVLGLTLPALAEEKKEEPKPYFSGAVAGLSQYIWRGYELSKDSVVIQPSLTVGYQGFEANLWGNLDTNDKFTKADKTNWNETDLTLSYTYDFGPVKLGGGYIYYALEGVEDSQELYLKIAGNVLLSPTLSIYREIANYPGWYFNLGISHSFNLTKEITLDLGAAIGSQISDTDKIVKYDSNLQPTTDKYDGFHLHDGNFSVGLTIPFGKYFSVKPVLAYSVALSDDAKNRIRGTSLSDKNDFLYGGIILTAAF
ncbi:MAG: hypothetical protein HY892_11660 [Deltaproteobacteria bacterium]|nr:hypothetical protein [Deltaproteobacteria bacterium]